MKRTYALILLGVVAALAPAHAPGCGPDAEVPLFFPEISPNVAPEDFLAGRLGVVRPELWIQHLAVAYRYLAGKPLEEAARKGYSHPARDDGWYISDDIWKRWLTLRAKVTPGAGPETPNGQRDDHRNCTAAAIESAADTLEKRITAFGAADMGIRSWVAAQDIVFANCNFGNGTPPEPEPGLPPLLAADRHHQIAAAHFYAGRLDPARERWLRIAQDSQSPWSDRAPYFAARCLIRKSTIPGENFDEPLMRKAVEELDALATQSRDKTVRDWSASLAAYARNRLDPYQGLVLLGARISDPAQDARFVDNVTEFDYLYCVRAAKLAPTGANDFADWILAARRKMPPADIIGKWRTTRSLPWLLWALAAMDRLSPEREELTRAAAAVPADSPAFATAAFHRVRLVMDDADPAAARALLDRLLPALQRSQPRVALNPFFAWRLSVARNLDEFLRYSGRRMVVVPDAEDEFDADVTGVFNDHLPFAMWKKAADSPTLPLDLRRLLCRTLWVRAVVAGDYRLAAELSPELRKAHPNLQSTFLAFENAVSPEERRFTSAYALLKSGLRPVLDEGYSSYERKEGEEVFPRTADWCQLDRPDKPDQQPAPRWLSASDRQQAAAELRRMGAQGPSSNFFVRAAIAWAKSHPRDPRSPEALHLGVRWTRYGCGDSDTGTASRAAFALLHKQYPNSEWARKTKYWYR